MELSLLDWFPKSDENTLLSFLYSIYTRIYVPNMRMSDFDHDFCTLPGLLIFLLRLYGPLSIRYGCWRLSTASSEENFRRDIKRGGRGSFGVRILYKSLPLTYKVYRSRSNIKISHSHAFNDIALKFRKRLFSLKSDIS
jgi:hypothetical protein